MYQLDKKSAENGSGNASRFLEEGLHEVVITQAYEVMAATNAKGVHIDFKDRQGNATCSLVFYVLNKDGQPIYGMDQLNAVMAVCKVKAITPQGGMVTYYDFDQKKDLQKQAMILTELVNKPLNLILHKEVNTYDGRSSLRTNMTAPLVAGTNQTAVEVLNNKEASSWESMLSYALERSQKAANQISQAQPQPASPQAGENYGGSTDYYDDDPIPF
jgi:hypothetical protein